MGDGQPTSAVPLGQGRLAQEDQVKHLATSSDHTVGKERKNRENRERLEREVVRNRPPPTYPSSFSLPAGGPIRNLALGRLREPGERVRDMGVLVILTILSRQHPQHSCYIARYNGLVVLFFSSLVYEL